MSNNVKKESENLELGEIGDIDSLEDSEVLKSVKDGVVIGDLWGYITDVNQAIVDMYAANDKNEFVDKHVLNFLVEEERERAVQDSLDSITTDKGITREYRARLKSGEVILLEVKTNFMRNKKGEKTGFVDLIKNITNNRNQSASP